jgi:hypothetical protein
MKLKLSLLGATLALALSAVVGVAATTAQASAPSKGSYALPANGTTTTGLPVVGTFTITKFTHSRSNGVVNAVGTFTGSVNGGPSVTTTASAPVTAINGTALNGTGSPLAAAAAAGSCQILDLTLGRCTSTCWV